MDIYGDQCIMLKRASRPTITTSNITNTSGISATHANLFKWLHVCSYLQGWNAQSVWIKLVACPIHFDLAMCYRRELAKCAACKHTRPYDLWCMYNRTEQLCRSSAHAHAVRQLVMFRGYLQTPTAPRHVSWYQLNSKLAAQPNNTAQTSTTSNPTTTKPTACAPQHRPDTDANDQTRLHSKAKNRHH